jgi:hypothetical protein
MSAAIKVEQGADSGLNYQIEEDVFRIGSNDRCSLRLTDSALPPHLVTVEYLNRQRQYLVHNKSGLPLTVNGQPLAPNTSSAWLPGQTLQLKGQVVLRLQIEGDPTPGKAAAPLSLRDLGTDKDTAAESAEQVAPPAPPKKSNTSTHIAVIAILGIIAALLVVIKIKQNNAPPPDEKEQPLHESELIEELRKTGNAGDDRASQALELLQDAAKAEHQGHKNTAKKLYQQLLLKLKTWQREDGTFVNDTDNKVFEQTWRFVIERAPGWPS